MEEEEIRKALKQRKPKSYPKAKIEPVPPYDPAKHPSKLEPIPPWKHTDKAKLQPMESNLPRRVSLSPSGDLGKASCVEARSLGTFKNVSDYTHKFKKMTDHTAMQPFIKGKGAK